MNREKFANMVRPYLTSTKGVNKSLIEEQFEKQQSKKIGTNYFIIEENKLLFIPTGQTNLGVFVFSDESDRYCYHGFALKEQQKIGEWTTYWSDKYNWIHFDEAISDMNQGRGWGAGAYYFTLEVPHLSDYMNWEHNPLEVKQ